MPWHKEGAGADALKPEFDVDAIVAFHFIGHGNECAQQFREVDRGRFLPLQFRVQTAGVGNVGDQSIEPLDVVLNDTEKTPAAFIASGQWQRLHRRTQRGERVFKFVRDVGGKALNGFNPAIHRVGHVAKSARQMSDLVAAAGEIGDFHARPNAAAHAFRRVRQPADRLGNGPRQKDGQYDHHAGGDQKDFQNR